MNKKVIASGLIFLLYPFWANAGIIYSEDFEDGVADGFNLPSLWHVTQNFPAGGSYALGFVQGESAGSTPNGNFNIGNTNQQTAFSPLI